MDNQVWVTVKVPLKLREDASKAAQAIDSDLSKELRRAMRELIAKAKSDEVAA